MSSQLITIVNYPAGISFPRDDENGTRRSRASNPCEATFGLKDHVNAQYLCACGWQTSMTASRPLSSLGALVPPFQIHSDFQLAERLVGFLLSTTGTAVWGEPGTCQRLLH